MKIDRFILMAAIAACCSAAARADGVDPHGIVKGGNTDAIAVTTEVPNPPFSGKATLNNNCVSPTTPCVYVVFQNQLDKTLLDLSIFVPTTHVDVDGTERLLTFSCGDQATEGAFFDQCKASSVKGGTDLVYSTDRLHGFDGVPSATFVCVPLLGGNPSCTWIGGIFVLDLEGKDLPLNTQIRGSAITSPEPGAGLLVLLGALAWACVLVVRKRAFSFVLERCEGVLRLCRTAQDIERAEHSSASKVAVISLIVLFATLLVGLQPACGDEGAVFDLTATFTDSSAVSGTLTIDLTTGVVEAADLSYGGKTYGNILDQGSFTGGTVSGHTPIPVGYLTDIVMGPGFPRLVILIPGTSAIDSLIGFTGGGLCSVAALCGPDEQGFLWSSGFFATASSAPAVLQSGDLVPAPAPEPDSSILLLTGMLGWGLPLGMKRTRQNPRASEA